MDDRFRTFLLWCALGLGALWWLYASLTDDCAWADDYAADMGVAECREEAAFWRAEFQRERLP